eukprot:TRINITY_DN10510_c0_g3_i1.p1 TRINITY_DN10510_c0_g3~~TRINITY_DN10510_c0_g3_i1.p1  ORF type:complete len:672 (-),score=107.97 TRINITY_DN10510_c0_g3_i1:141-2156(-)
MRSGVGAKIVETYIRVTRHVIMLVFFALLFDPRLHLVRGICTYKDVVGGRSYDFRSLNYTNGLSSGPVKVSQTTTALYTLNPCGGYNYGNYTAQARISRNGNDVSLVLLGDAMSPSITIYDDNDDDGDDRGLSISYSGGTGSSSICPLGQRITLLLLCSATSRTTDPPSLEFVSARSDCEPTFRILTKTACGDNVQTHQEGGLSSSVGCSIGSCANWAIIVVAIVIFVAILFAMWRVSVKRKQAKRNGYNDTSSRHGSKNNKTSDISLSVYDPSSSPPTKEDTMFTYLSDLIIDFNLASSSSSSNINSNNNDNNNIHIIYGSWQGLSVSLLPLWRDLPSSSSSSPSAVAEMVQRKLATLTTVVRHPFLAPVHGLWRDKRAGTTYIVTENRHVTGGTTLSLKDYLDSKYFSKMNNGVVTIIQLACDVAEGMMYLSSIPFVHNNLRMDSIFIVLNTAATITSDDNNLSSASSSSSSSSSVPPLVQISNYSLLNGVRHLWTAPEVLEGISVPNEKTDVWAYGLLLQEIFTHVKGSRTYITTTSSHLNDHDCDDDMIMHEVSLDETKSVSTTDMHPQPEHIMPAKIEKLARLCCHPDSSKRPTFTEIFGIIKRSLNTSEDNNVLSDDSPPVLSSQSPHTPLPPLQSSASFIMSSPELSFRLNASGSIDSNDGTQL